VCILFGAAVRAIGARLAQLIVRDEDDLFGVYLADEIVAFLLAPVKEPPVQPVG
jgi:hypothetical protein